jgi:cyclic beta-1,2-glucan synthetase
VKDSIVRRLMGLLLADPREPEEPIRSELFSTERLEQHAESLARAQRVTRKPERGQPLVRRLRANGRALLAAYRAIGAAIREERTITPAAEWLVDNFHIAEEQIREILDDLPRGFYRQLPKLADGPLAGYPRVFGVAWAFVAHTDSLFDPQTLCRFVRAYQRVQPLTIGELWAMAITLRIVLVENLRRAADRIVRGRAARQEADALADRVLGAGNREAEHVEAVLQGFGRTLLPANFAAELVHRLRDQDPVVSTPALRWLDDRLLAQGTSADEIVREEHQRQGAMNVTVRNVITSMRLMSAVDWAEFFEGVSLVDAMLRAESDFGAMDFATRDQYRHAIEELARGSGLAEPEVTRRAILATKRAPSGRPTCGETANPEQDPGHFLISKGRRSFEREIGARVPIGHWLARTYVAAGLPGYLAGVTAVALAVLALALLGVAQLGVGGSGLLLLALAGFIPASEVAVALVNRHLSNRFGPRALPGMELRDGVPSGLRTLVAVPTLLTTRTAIEEQIEHLEVHHLASPEDNFCFALLSDWTDSSDERAPGDEELLAVAAAGIARLNEQYGRGPDGDRFLLLHRRRVWNAGEGKWIGWERKRGKLHELNQLLRGAAGTTFMSISAHAPKVPRDVRYVITLDADTRLPRGAARRLVGKMAHALNRPRFDLRKRRVVDGYAILQPRVTPTLPARREASLFQRAFSGPGGMDPYASAVSDVYQDLLGEGSFTGKGIYDVDVFEAALDGRVPESSVLSHDLLEGVFARAGLVSDIEVVEEFPSRYDVAAARQHRWARGDWQLIPWIFGRGRASNPNSADRAIPFIGRWKMMDNLRRTLAAPATVLALLAGWTLPRGAAALWTIGVLAMIALPPSLPLLAGVVPRRIGLSKRSHLRAVGADLALALLQIALLVTFLAHQAWLMSDAIARTIVRLFVTRRHMLEWVTAAQAKFGLPLDTRGFYQRMAGGVVLAAVVGAAVALVAPMAWPIAAPFVILWVLSPIVAQRASRPPPLAGPTGLSPDDAKALRCIARRTWRFFDTFVGAEDNHLPPDNFQEDPTPVVAHRTSPTNLGLYLLSVVVARDFGWVGTRDMIERLEDSLATMKRLERFHGHFYNWYDTRTLRPLEPKYVSSVDSGNLAGHLIALAGACKEQSEAAVLAPQWRAGIADTLAITRECLREVSEVRRAQTVTRRQLDEALDLLAALLQPISDTPGAVAGRLEDLARQADTIVDMAGTLAAEGAGAGATEVLGWAEAIRACIRSHARDVELISASPVSSSVSTASPELHRRLSAVRECAAKMSDAMDFGCLFDPVRQLLSIGLLAAERRLDPSCYDLLASEARLASFVAIAKGDVPAQHWFRLGRTLTPVDRGSALVSWSGSMFEYLMPSLVMRAPAGSLLEQTSRLVVRRQIRYGAELGVPWGVSESAYNVRDVELTYQYSNFGVPGLGLKRGLSEDAVIAPYATALAAMVDGKAATQNFSRLAAAGARGRYGFYEALDYTPTRLPKSETVSVVRAYMAHHQGMTLVAIGNALDDGAMRARFHAEPMVQATELLLQERTPREVLVARPRAEEVRGAAVHRILPPKLRRFHSPHGSIPRTHLLSNGRYAVMLTAAGSGYSRWRDLAVTRWREDVTCDCWGSYVFLRDLASGDMWSAGYQPSGVEPESYEVEFSEGQAEIVRHDGTITTTLKVVVSAEEDAEVRHVTISNLGLRAREIELTSYSEVVLAPPAADAAHPAFSKLFVQTEFVDDVGVLLATRRRRSPGEAEVWAAHLAVVQGEMLGEVQFETDRSRFLGRGHDIRTAISMLDGQPLSNTAGAVLDPIFSLRCRVRIPPGATARVAFWTAIATSRSEALDLADKHRDASAFERAVTLAWTQAQVQLHHLGCAPEEAYLFQRLANHVIYANPLLRPSSVVLERNERGQSMLWPHAISGDLPIVLVRIDEVEDLEIVRQLLRAHQYWQMKQLAVDLVILNERPASYAQDLHAAVQALVRASQSRPRPEGEGGGRRSVFVLRADQISVETRTLLQTAARAVLLSRRGSLSEQVNHLEEELRAPRPVPARSSARMSLPPRRQAGTKKKSGAPAPSQYPTMEFFNGLGGFTAGGREYVTVLGEGQWTPAPWVNVIANPSFGFHVSVEGGGYTWAVNSRDHQLTPWSNDPVADYPGEVLYVRDEESGALWCPTALPIRDEEGSYVARHGPGYSRFEHSAHGIGLELLQYVAPADPIKISRLTIRNDSGRSRRLSITAYVEWVLGSARGASAQFVVTEVDAGTGVLLARNPWSAEFGARVAFADLGGMQIGWTGDRTEFVGRNGTLARPVALAAKVGLSNRVGAGFDPCGVLQSPLTLEPNSAVEVVFFLGEASTRAEAVSTAIRYRGVDLDEIFRAVSEYWEAILGAVQVKTPDRSMDILLNGWLLYQTLACRSFARSAFYQASGAYGFRDQLQDAMALAISKPELTRRHLLRAAARQFVDGDVQHWWLPASGQGVRTRISDDRVWLAYVASHYVRVTGDSGVLDEVVPFIEGPALRPNEHDSYFQPMIADDGAALFEHCARGLDSCLAVGEHGLPLMGAGDWNDGMCRVGEAGRGESVWLGWFLYATLADFAPLAAVRGESARARIWRRHAGALRRALEREAWDGQWYRRAYFDDGTPLGSASSDECRIDSIAQSWAVMSGAADPARAARAMASVNELLVRRGDGLVLLFTPPFDQSPLDPGYIKGYPPGVRENGGQYTHAAAWAVIAFAMLGDGDKAGELFSLLNPIHHSDTRAASHRYKVEPYVASADVYSQPPHVGRGGWTWYTGSAGWLYRAGVEWILGLRVEGATLRIDPCVPKTWRGFEIIFRYHSARYEIAVSNPNAVSRGVAHAELDGATLPEDQACIELVDDGATHHVHVTLG